MKRKTILVLFVIIMILIIAISVILYNRVVNTINNSLTDSSSQISIQEKKGFNMQFEVYGSKQIGGNVKSLINTMKSNTQFNMYEEDKLPDLVIQIEDGTSKYVRSYVDNINIEGFNQISNIIDIKHEYYVTLEYGPEGMVDLIIIEYDKGNLDDIISKNKYRTKGRISDLSVFGEGLGEKNIVDKSYEEYQDNGNIVYHKVTE